MEFRQRLRLLRTEQNITQATLADYLDYGYTAISNYESGRNEPSINDLIKISDFFHVSVDYLVGKSPLRKNQGNITAAELDKLLILTEKIQLETNEILITLKQII